MRTLVYDDRFNANEWFVILLLVAGLAVTFSLPRRFPVKQSAVFFIFGLFGGLFLDHTISVYPIDFYDVNDASRYEWMDFLTYLMYSPFSYLYAYCLDKWKIKPAYVPLYIIAWGLISTGLEGLAVLAGVFHYKNGYGIFFSFPIYLIMNSFYTMLLYAIQGLPRRVNA